MHRLFPELTPHHEEVLTTTDGQHHLWTALFGNPDGLPVICLHGGPGAGTSPFMPRFFNPEVFNILCFDQRGCGRSEPNGSLFKNTTDKLISDLDLITTRFGLERYILFGGSWGATLALLYAMEHPGRCLGLILRGVYLNTTDNLDWLYGGGAASEYSAAWSDFLAPIEQAKLPVKTVFEAYKKLLHAKDEFTRLQAARAWNLWEYRLSNCDSTAKKTGRMSPRHEMSTAKIEHHYLSQRCFLEADIFSVKNSELASTPMFLLHGLKDHVCPIRNAFDLKELYPNLRLRVLDEAGHSAFGPQMAEGLCQATSQMAALYGHT